MRVVLLASAAILSISSMGWAQDADRMKSDRQAPGASRQMGGADHDRKGADSDRSRRGSSDQRKEDRAGDRDSRLGSRADNDELRSDRVRGREKDVDHGSRERKQVIERDDPAVRVHSGRERDVRETDVGTHTRRHVSIAPERRTHYREAFVKTYKERPAQDVDVRVGARLPEQVIVERVPDTYYDEDPGLRGLSYFVDRGHAYLVDPGSREVIDDLD